MPPSEAKKSGPRTHSESRSCLCGVCFKKEPGGLRSIMENTEKLIQQFVNQAFSLSNPSLPTSIWNKCRGKLAALNKVNEIIPKYNIKNISRILMAQTTSSSLATSSWSHLIPVPETWMNSLVCVLCASWLGPHCNRIQNLWSQSLFSQVSQPHLLLTPMHQWLEASVPSASPTLVEGCHMSAPRTLGEQTKLMQWKVAQPKQNPKLHPILWNISLMSRGWRKEGELPCLKLVPSHLGFL